MKPLPLFTAVAAMAFGTHRPTTIATCTNQPADTVQPSLFHPLYSSSFAKGEPANAKTVLTFWRNWDKNELDKSFALLADSVEFILPGCTATKKPDGPT